MSEKTVREPEFPAIIEAAQDTYSDEAGGERLEQQEVPGSPKSDSEWEMLPDTSVPSDCGSSAKSVHMGDASVNTLGSPQVPDAIPHLHVNLTPQGSSDISLELTTRHPAAFSLPGAALLFSHAQWQYQDQLRKAQETLLPQADGQATESYVTFFLLSSPPAHSATDMQQACSQQQSSLGEEELGQATAFPEDTVHETLPTSTLMSLQADAQDTEPDSDSPSAATSLAPSSAAHLPGCNSTGQLSFMSDGSFVHVGDTAQADGEVSNQEEALDQEEALPPIITESVTLEHVSQQADALLDQLSEDLPEAPEAAEADAADMHAEASVEIDEDKSNAEPSAFCKYTDWPRLAAAIQHRLAQLLSTWKVWTASACGALPSSASVYASTIGIFGSKSPLRRFDRVHWSLVSGLVAVSAIYMIREHSFSARERHLRRELNNSQAEISKLVMKIVGMQHSMQSPGRVPIIRHTCSMSALTPFPMLHLV